MPFKRYVTQVRIVKVGIIDCVSENETEVCIIGRMGLYTRNKTAQKYIVHETFMAAKNHLVQQMQNQIEKLKNEQCELEEKLKTVEQTDENNTFEFNFF
jgi:predicted ribosome quality control (RQC) complex YloA/Tae2 family protein